MSKDLTKPFFKEDEKDDINGFLFDYSRYAKSKGWDDEMKCGMILKKGIVKVINAENDEKLKINRLRNIKQGEKETLQDYISRFEAYADAVKGLMRKGIGIWIECRKTIDVRDRERNDKRGLPIAEEKAHANNHNIDSIAVMIEALTINYMKQEINDASRLDKIETEIKEMMRMTP
ncbi:2551_t:CDS:2 [Cetraspora pellucida]|uniref:2551_t:CDS:1 n=1 Tax=Cetraspora pellucida TaxID=1433469 RepID=A0A9N9JJM5_9GLOM|nr:2551_t:CDS:2 [Cetraspora pellucida]